MHHFSSHSCKGLSHFFWYCFLSQDLAFLSKGNGVFLQPPEAVDNIWHVYYLFLFLFFSDWRYSKCTISVNSRYILHKCNLFNIYSKYMGNYKTLSAYFLFLRANRVRKREHTAIFPGRKNEREKKSKFLSMPERIENQRRSSVPRKEVI